MQCRGWWSRRAFGALIAIGLAACGDNGAAPSDASVAFDGQSPVQLVASPPAVAFGTVPVGALSATRTVAISNLGQTATTQLAITTSAGFVFASTCGFELRGAGGTCTVAVAAAPDASGALSGELRIADGSTVVVVDLSAAVPVPIPFALSTASKDFGSLETGQITAPAMFTVTNTSTFAVNGIAIEPGGADPAPFAIASNTCSSLAPGASCAVAIAFAPLATHESSAAFTIAGIGAVRTVVTVTGEGVATALSISSTSGFGTESVDTPPLPSVPFTVTNNTGASVTLAASIGGTGATCFHITQDACSGVPLASQATCVVDVQFTPRDPAGPKSASLDVGNASLATSAALTAYVTTDGGAWLVIGPLPNPHDYGNVGIGLSASRMFTVTNPGNLPTGALTVTLSTTSEFTISQDTCSAMPLAPFGGSCTLSVTFHPSTPGRNTASVGVSAGASQTTMGLVGTGITDGGGFIAANPGQLVFGTVAVGQTGIMSLTIANEGAATTPPLTVGIAGANPSQFAIAADGCSGMPLANFQSCTVQIAFSPTSSGAKQATASVTGGGTTGVALSGIGGGTGLSVTPSSYDYGTVHIVSIGSQTFTVTNGSGIASGALTTSVTGANATDFAIVQDTCAGAMLAAASSCTLVVEFQPMTNGSKVATLTIADGAQSVSASLSGMGMSGGGGGVIVDPDVVDYGTVVVGNTGMVTITVTNAAAIAQGPGMLQLGGVNVSQFAIGTDTCTGATLVNGQSCTIQVLFSPGSAGAKHASLTVIVGSAQNLVVLDGTGG